MLADHLSVIDSAIDAIERPRGATEPRLTATMAELLARDEHAAATLARALVNAAPNRAARERLGPVPPRLLARSEYVYTAGGRLLRRRSRRADLVLTAAGTWALVIEAKLDAPFAKGQLQDLLVAKATALDLDRDASIGVLALTSYTHALGRLKDPQRRWLGRVRWADVLEYLLDLEFDDRQLTTRWQRLLSVYLRRERISPRAVTRAAPRTLLEFTADRTRGHLEHLLGVQVELLGNRSGRVVQGGSRTGWIQYGYRQRGRKRVLTIEAHRPKQRPRLLVIHEQTSDARIEVPRAPAELNAFEQTLHRKLDEFFALDGRKPRL